MPSHEQIRPTHRDNEAETDASQEYAGEEQVKAVDTDISDVLAEIDEVLEKNAEEFVRGYVQKGGQ